MGKVKNGHYVPRSYLKYFANKKSKDNYQIYVFDKIDKKGGFPTNTKNVASEGYFYNLPLDLMPNSELLNNEQIIEDFFSQSIEGRFESLLNNIRTRYTLSPNPNQREAITNKEKVELSFLFTFQYLRTKDFRETYLTGQDKFIQALNDSLIFKKYGKHIDEKIHRHKEFDSIRHAEFMFNEETLMKFSSVFLNHIWLVMVNNTDLPFYTSDSPITKYAHKKSNGLMSNSGLASPGIEITFPISSKLSISILERSFFNKLSLTGIENTFYAINDRKDIIFYNWLQVINSYRQVYCKENSFEIINEMEKHQSDILEKKSKPVIYFGGKKY